MIGRIIRNKKTNLADVEIERAFDSRHLYDLVTVKAEFIGCPTEESMKALSHQLVLSGCMAHADAPTEKTVPERVIFNPPATIAFWNDGTKTVAKAKDGDEFDPLLGIMVCALRKVGKNRVSIDSWEPVIALLSDDLASAKECRLVADVLNATADAWELAGVADELDKWADEESEEEEPTEPNGTWASETCLNVGIDHDAMRQAIRDLIDRGEL